MTKAKSKELGKVPEKLGGSQTFLQRVFSRKTAVVGFIGVCFFIFIAVFAGVLTPYDPNKADAKAILQQPSIQHLLGTDNFGRDTLTRLMYGARVSLLVGVLATVIACIIGVFLGLCASYFGGIVDTLIMRICEAIMSIPRIMLSMALVVIVGNSITDLAIVLSIGTIPMYVRMTRAVSLKTRGGDYVKAAQISGGSSFHIILRHILPNTISPILIIMMQNVGSTILMEAGLSYLGIGVTVPIASWGTMVSLGRTYLLNNPVLSLSPGFCVALLVVCLNMLGDGIRDALDPRLRGQA